MGGRVLIRGSFSWREFSMHGGEGFFLGGGDFSGRVNQDDNFPVLDELPRGVALASR